MTHELINIYNQKPIIKMAEKTNKKGEEKNTQKTVDVDNIRESLGKGILVTTDLGEEIEKEIQKEKDEETKRQTKSRILKARYQVFEGLLKLRRERDIHDIQHEELSQVDRLARYLMGFVFDCNDLKFRHADDKKLPDTLFEKEKIDFDKKTIEIILVDGTKKTFKDGEKVPAVINYVQYDALRKKITEDTRKKIAKAEEAHVESLKALDAEFGDYYEHSWRY